MRSPRYFLAAALIVGVSATAMAQTTNPPPPAPAPALAPTNDLGLARSHWVASGSVGSNFGSTASNVDIDHRRSWDFGAQGAYLWRGVVGGEFIADFTPSFGVETFTDSNNPHVNTYMGNAIGAIPIGPNGQFQPYVSGGYGGMQMRFADIGNTNVSSNEFTGAVNGGGGIMAFLGRSRFGFRADARFYHAMSNNTLSGTTADQVTQALLSDLDFWRTNVGVAYQW